MMSRLQGMAKLRASYHPNNSMGSKKVIRDSDLSVVIDPLRWLVDGWVGRWVG